MRWWRARGTAAAAGPAHLDAGVARGVGRTRGDALRAVLAQALGDVGRLDCCAKVPVRREQGDLPERQRTDEP